jgi:inhibitor of KinA sporulation pathway (predicted exonuclease)
MKINYDSILVVQIKTTCPKEEIIEFGACLFKTKTLRAYEPFGVIVKPDCETAEFCSAQTDITPEDVASGVSFCELMEYLQDIYKPYERPWASYGNLAEQTIRRQCVDNGISYPMSDRFLNIKNLMPIMFGLQEEIDLSGAIKKLKLNIPEALDSQDEVLNASIVLGEILRGGPLPK